MGIRKASWLMICGFVFLGGLSAFQNFKKLLA